MEVVADPRQGGGRRGKPKGLGNGRSFKAVVGKWAFFGPCIILTALLSMTSSVARGSLRANSSTIKPCK